MHAPLEETEMEDEEQTTNETNGTDISEEQVIEQQIIPFMGDDLAAALAPGGNIYITLPGMCTALGLNTRGQLQRIQRTRTPLLSLNLPRNSTFFPVCWLGNGPTSPGR